MKKQNDNLKKKWEYDKFIGKMYFQIKTKVDFRVLDPIIIVHDPLIDLAAGLREQVISESI